MSRKSLSPHDCPAGRPAVARGPFPGLSWQDDTAFQDQTSPAASPFPLTSGPGQPKWPVTSAAGAIPPGRPARRRHSTILEIGISRMSLAPADFSAGIRALTPRLGTTV